MVHFCCVSGCTNSKRYKSAVKGDGSVSLSFHRFPKHPVIRQEWISAVRRGNFDPNEHHTVCSAHFKPEDYYPVYASGVKKLRENAVPSIFDFCDLRFNANQLKVSDHMKIQPCEASCNNLSDYPELKVILPPYYSYHVCEWTDLGSGWFNTLFRVNVPTEETAFIWLKEFKVTSKAEFCKMERNWNFIISTGDAIQNIFKYKCVHGVRKRSRRFTNCLAKLLITIKETQSGNCQSSDVHMPDYPMVVTYRNIHNHPLKKSDNVEATTKPFVHFLRSVEENDPDKDTGPPISDSTADKSEVTEETENLIVEPDLNAMIDDQFEVDDSSLSDEDFPLDNKEHTSETQKTKLPDPPRQIKRLRTDSSLSDEAFPLDNKEHTRETQKTNPPDPPRQIKKLRPLIPKTNVPPSSHKEQITDTQKTNLPQTNLTPANNLPLIVIQNIIPVPLQNPFLQKTDLTLDKKEQTLKDFLSFANSIVEKSRNNEETFHAVKTFMENVKNMNSDDSINSALVNFGKINRYCNLERKETKSSNITKKTVFRRIIKKEIK